MTTAIGFFHFALACADDHVEIILQHGGHKPGRGDSIIGRITVGHDVDVSIHIGEHAAHDMALALLRHAANDRASSSGEFSAAVAAVIIEDVDVGGGQCATEILHRLHDRARFIIAGQDYGNARTYRPLPACHCRKFLHLPQTSPELIAA